MNLNIFNKAVAEKKPETGNRIMAEVPQAISEAVLFATMGSIGATIRFDPQALEAVKKAQESWQTLRTEQAKYSSVNVSRAHEGQRKAVADAVKAGKPIPQTYGLAEIQNTFTQKRMAHFDAMESVTISAFPQVKVLLGQFLAEIQELETDRAARRALDLDMDVLSIVREFVQRRLDFTRTPAHPHSSPQALLEGILTLNK